MSLTVSVIVPCYNEEENIQECIRRILQICSDYEIIVVDDGSQDRTSGKAKEVSRENVTVIRYEKNRGKGYALRVGLASAKGDVIVIQDADMATPPEEIPSILQPILNGEADFVNGTRLVHPMEKGAMKRLHIIGNGIFALIVSALIGQRLTDTLCGFKAFRKDRIRGKLEEDNWPDFELLIKAKRNGLQIVEVPIHYHSRKGGRSKMRTFRHGYDMLRMLIRSLLT